MSALLEVRGLRAAYGASEVLWASLQIMGGQAIISLLALALATLTANYSRFVVAFFLTLFAWVSGAFPVFRYYWSGIKGSVQLTRMQLVAIVALDEDIHADAARFTLQRCEVRIGDRIHDEQDAIGAP